MLCGFIIVHLVQMDLCGSCITQEAKILSEKQKGFRDGLSYSTLAAQKSWSVCMEMGLQVMVGQLNLGYGYWVS